MNVTYQFIKHDGTLTTHSDELRGEPGTWYDQLHAIFERHFGPDVEMEHVNVWTDDHYTDMFVDETGMLKGLPVNVVATKVYQANVQAHDVNPPDPRDMPMIYGDAILFNKRVWY